MNNQYNKPKLTAIQLVSMMSKEKGITFKHMTRAQAVIFLEERNNFFRLASYRKNYDKQQSGAYVNKHYINLDFAYLVELSTLDMYLRNIIMQMCIDVEHCLKVNLLTDLSKNSSENGYSLVNEFLNAKSNNYIVKSVIKKSNSKYSGDLICKYFTYQYTPKNDSSNPNAYVFDCPAWVLVDTISFGDFIKFYNWYYKKYPNSFVVPAPILNSVKNLRNACAHNNCILHDLRYSENTKPSSTISKFIAQIPTISLNQRQKRLKNQFMLDFSSLIYVYDNVVSKDIKHNRYKELKKFTKRLLYRDYYFSSNRLIESSLLFLKNIIDFLR